MNCSASREAVPLPMAMAVTPKRRHRSMMSLRARALAASCPGRVKWPTPVASTLPFSSTTASLQPVRKPGSTPSVTRPLTGGAMSSWCRFLPNT